MYEAVKIPPTPAQKRVLDAIRELTARDGYCPTYDEIAAHVGLASKATVMAAVLGLEARNQIRRLPGKLRSIAII